MKKIVIVSILILAAAAVFATGNQEVNEDGVVELERGGFARNSYLDDLEKIEVTGVVKFESPVAELRVGGKDYTLTAPGVQMFSSYLSEGQRITVAGYVLDDDADFGFGMGGAGRRGGAGGWSQDLEVLEGNITLMVETVEIDGVVYQLPWVSGDDFGNRGGRGYGMMGGNNFRQGGRNGGFINGDCPYYN